MSDRELSPQPWTTGTSPEEQFMLMFLQEGGKNPIISEWQRRTLARGLADWQEQLEDAEIHFKELDNKLKSDCKAVSPTKRVEKNSDLGHGAAYRGLIYVTGKIRDDWKKAKDRLAWLKWSIPIIEQALADYDALQKEKEEEAARLKKAKRLRDLKKVETEYKTLCKRIPIQAEMMVDVVMNRPLTVSNTVMEQEISAYTVGKAMKDLPVMKRWLEEQGIKGLPEPPKLKIPSGFREQLERILGRKLHKIELLKRDGKWWRMEQAHRKADALAELSRLEAEEIAEEAQA